MYIVGCVLVLADASVWLNCLLLLDAVVGLVRLARVTSRSHARPLRPPPKPEWLHQRRRGNASTPVYTNNFCMYDSCAILCMSNAARHHRADHDAVRLVRLLA